MNPFSSTDPDCWICKADNSTEQSHLTSLLALRRSLGRLLNDSAFPYIENLTTHIVPLKFILQDLRILFRRKVPVGKLTQQWMYCKQPIRTLYLGHVTGYQPIRDQFLNSVGSWCELTDPVDIESEWEMLCENFGPTDAITCSSETEFSVPRCATCLAKRPPFDNRAIYVRVDRTSQKRRRQTDIQLCVSSNDTLFDVKVKLCERLAIAPADQEISTQKGTVLKEGRIGDLGIEPGCLLYLEQHTVTGELTEGGTDTQERGFTGTFLTQYNTV
eukprot:sb/3468095/